MRVRISGDQFTDGVYYKTGQIVDLREDKALYMIAIKYATPVVDKPRQSRTKEAEE